MIWCWLFGHNYTSPNWGTELVRGTNPFCYRCGKPPKDLYTINHELMELMQEMHDYIHKLECKDKDETK